MVQAIGIAFLVMRALLLAYTLKLAHARKSNMILATLVGFFTSPLLTLPVILLQKYRNEEAKQKDKAFNKKLWGAILKPGIFVGKVVGQILGSFLALPLYAVGLKPDRLFSKKIEDINRDTKNEIKMNTMKKEVEKELLVDTEKGLSVDLSCGYDKEYAKVCLASYEQKEVKKVGSEEMETAFRLKVCNYPDGKQVVFCPEYLKEAIRDCLEDSVGISKKFIVDTPLNESSYMIVQQKATPTGRMTPVYSEFSYWFIPDTNRVMSSEKVYEKQMEKMIFENVKKEARDINKVLHNEIVAAGVKHPDQDFRYRNAMSLNIVFNKIVLEIGGEPLAYMNYDEKTGKISKAITEKARSLTFVTENGKQSVSEILEGTSGIHQTIGVFRQLVLNGENISNATKNLEAYLQQEGNIGLSQSHSQSSDINKDRSVGDN